ncbi:MAG: riboflavin synthase subunit alpha [Parashewanella sp.]
MFTGIVQATCEVVSVDLHNGIKKLAIELGSDLTDGLAIGASVAINGVCLTVTQLVNGRVFFDVMEETLQLSNLRTLKQSDSVNVERSLTFGSEIGGHILSGHIHTQATVISISCSDKHHTIELEVDKKWMKFILYKGFIAINGCSLTIGEVNENQFLIHLIPETLRLTNLKNCQKGSLLNIEIDSQTQTIVETVERVLAANNS